MKYLFICIGLINLSIQLTGQTTITLQPGPSDGKDARIWSVNDQLNAGDLDEFIAAAWTYGGTPGSVRSLMQFDLASIPTGAQIVSARLSLYHNFVSTTAGHAGENAVFLRRITQDWDEHTVNWANQPASTSLHQVRIPKSATVDQDYENINVTLLLRDMMADPQHSFGLMMMLEVEEYYRAMKFFSSDGTHPELRPKLSITYTTDALTCVTLQPGAEGKDARVISLFPDTNYGNHEEMLAATWTYGGLEGISRSYIDFDLTSVPANAEIGSAFLSFYYCDGSGHAGHAGTNTSVLERITGPWDENTVTWNTQPATTASNEVLLAESITTNQDYPDIDVTPLVQDMLADPVNSYGFRLRLQNEEILTSLKFGSGDWSIPEERPRLDVCYLLNTATQQVKYSNADIHPNPFTNSFYIDHVQGKYFVSISDASGKIIYTENLESQNEQISVEKLGQLSPGLYIVKAIGEDQNYLGKIVKAAE